VLALQAPPPPRPVADVHVLEATVEHEHGESWTPESTSFPMAPGERLRTGAEGLAVLRLPWMEIVIGGDSLVALPPTAVLSTLLEKGRIEQRASSDILKVKTPEAEVRGRGSVVVSRSDTGKVTWISPREGAFLVKSGRHVVVLAPGEGAIVRGEGSEPLTVSLPAPPREVSPGADPVYAPRGHPITLAWKGAAHRYHVDVSSLSGEEPLLSRDVEGRELAVALPVLGTFRWRVAAIDENGTEGLPSAAGFFCVVEK
jgi:hypothetical protein